MRVGETVRFTHVTTVEPGIQLGWKAGGSKPQRRVFVALILGVELHPDDIPDGADFDQLYAEGTLCDPNEALAGMGWKRKEDPA